MTIRIQIVEDDALYAKLLVDLLDRSPHLLCEGVATTKAEFLAILPHSRADVFLLDVGLTLHIEDDGPGINGWSNEAQAFALANAKRGLGLRSLRARVNGLGGRIVIHSEAGLHTRILIDFALGSKDSYSQETRF